MATALNTDSTDTPALNGYLPHILESIPTGIIALDNQGRIVIFNRTAERITGFAAERVLGMAFEGVFKAEYFQNSAGNLEDILKIKKTTEIKTKWSPDQRGDLHLNIAISPVTAQPEGKIGTVLSLTDVTRMQNLETQANRTGRLTAMGEMAVRIAHEIRNPLGSIELFSTMLMDDLKEYDDLKALAEHISSGVKSINSIVSNLLLFVRPDQQIDRQVLDIHEALKDSLFFAGHLFDAHDGIEVLTDLSDENLFVRGDLELLKQVFLNLILNAIQAMSAGGQLHISSHKIRGQQGTDWAEVHLCDTGCGIEQTDIQKIFDPFFTTRKKGTGLGLTIAHNIIKMHGGNIDVNSHGAQGTQCILSLPLWEGHHRG
ncbi:MAG: ATP-binding protein [Deltaproteobacteria bacterium]